jgi:Family of unknown function (DUF6152)
MSRLNHIVSHATRDPKLGHLEPKKIPPFARQAECSVIWPPEPRFPSNRTHGELRLTPKGDWHMVLLKDRIEIPEGTQMKNSLLAVFLAATGHLVVSAPVLAHHGRSNYDVTASATVKGIVTEFQWVNPHALILVDVTDENGKVEKWIAETNSPNTLSRQGWNRNTVKAGDQVTLVGHRVKGGGYYINFSKITFADGKELNPAVQN